jgi:hypothetical protein
MNILSSAVFGFLGGGGLLGFGRGGREGCLIWSTSIGVGDDDRAFCSGVGARDASISLASVTSGGCAELPTELAVDALRWKSEGVVRPEGIDSGSGDALRLTPFMVGIEGMLAIAGARGCPGREKYAVEP